MFMAILVWPVSAATSSSVGFPGVAAVISLIVPVCAPVASCAIEGIAIVMNKRRIKGITIFRKLTFEKLLYP